MLVNEQIAACHSAVVTGARRGLGRAIAIRLAEDGAGVIVCDRNEDGLSDTVNLIERAGGRAYALCADVARSEDMAMVVEEAKRRFGPLKRAVNNAAVPPPVTAFHEIDPAVWRGNIDINLNGVFFGMMHQIAAMLADGGGAIVNISSMAARLSVPGSHVYSVAKRGVLAMTSTAAVEYGAKGVRINAVLPGYIKGELADEVEKDNPSAPNRS